MKNKKVLIIYNKLFHYRIPIFNILSDKVDLTVAYSLGNTENNNLKFKILKLPIFKLNRFVIHKNNISKLANQFDVVIVYGDIAWLSLSFLSFRRNRKYKVIIWSIGVSASYDKKYDAVSTWDNVRNFFYRKADALVFYTSYPFKKYISNGFNPKSLFEACNTVKIYNGEIKNEGKNSFLFIGTLYLEKGILVLLENYLKAYVKNENVLILNIIGDGPEYQIVNNWIESNNLSHKIFLRGPIFDIEKKAKFFMSAYACITPFQAGLSVLESMGYGVPYITMEDAITGGERFNIENGKNGILLQNTEQIESILLDITSNPSKYIEMGKNARSFYMENRKPEDMAKGLLKAINYVSTLN